MHENVHDIALLITYRNKVLRFAAVRNAGAGTAGNSQTRNFASDLSSNYKVKCL